jgi:hypothetical protein
VATKPTKAKADPAIIEAAQPSKIPEPTGNYGRYIVIAHKDVWGGFTSREVARKLRNALQAEKREAKISRGPDHPQGASREA